MIYTFQKWRIQNCPVSDGFFYYILLIKIDVLKKKCLACMGLPEFQLKNLYLCSKKIIEIFNSYYSWWNAIIIGDYGESGSMIDIEKSTDFENFGKSDVQDGCRKVKKDHNMDQYLFGTISSVYLQNY